MNRPSLRKAVLSAVAFLALPIGAAQAQDWGNYLHWPYSPPQTPGNGFQYQPLHDNFYLYPREQRIVPQIQGPLYRNYYGGKRILGHRFPNEHHDWTNKKYYSGYHHTLDVF